MTVAIRDERPDDVAAVRRVNELAFGQPQEADLVEALRRACPDLLSLVALDGDELVGHILFSPATIDGADGARRGMGLAPMAVLPARQRRGIGTMLVGAGLARLRQANCPFVIVLGHPAYYPRFGFERASAYGIRCQWPGVPDEALMILVRDPASVAGTPGTARYRDEFDRAM